MPRDRPRINFAGHLNSETSIGKAARDNIRALSVNFDITLNEITLSGNDDGRKFFAGHQLSESNPSPANILHFNPDQTEKFIRRYGRSYFGGKHSIGFWVWEVTKVLPRWKAAAQFYDQIWTASEYCANVFSEEFPDIPVNVVPHLVDVAKPSIAGRDDFGIPGDKFAFFFAFDAWSRIDRKNPEALVEAFRIVSDEFPDSVLVVKPRNLDQKSKERIFGSIDRKRLVFIDKYLEDADLSALVACCNCFVSLHRSEGFGLHLAEAMALGVPVVATGYSGNMQFMRANNSWQVKFDLKPSLDPYYKPSGGLWADPDVVHAAEQMLDVISGYGGKSKQVADKGREFILKHHSISAISEAMVKAYRER